MNWMWLVLVTLLAPPPEVQVAAEVAKLRAAIAKHKAIEAAEARAFDLMVKQDDGATLTITPAVVLKGADIKVVICYDAGPPCMVPSLEWEMKDGKQVAALSPTRQGPATIFVRITAPGRTMTVLQQRTVMQVVAANGG